MEKYLNIDEGDPRPAIAHEGHTKKYLNIDEGDPRPAIAPNPEIPPDAVDAAGNPQPGVADRFQPRYHTVEPKETESVSPGVVLLAIAALLAVAVAFGFDRNSKPIQNTAMNEQPGTTYVIQPQAQPMPEQPPPAGNNTQP